MLSRFKSAIYNAVSNLDQNQTNFGNRSDSQIGNNNSINSGNNSSNGQSFGAQTKFRYQRPQFLQLNSDDEISVSADHIIRPIIVPRDITKLPFNSGYAETINAGKSIRNEDQASVYRGILRVIVSPENIANKVSDMMPTVPGHPQQIPINHKTDSLKRNSLKTQTIETMKTVENTIKPNEVICNGIETQLQENETKVEPTKTSEDSEPDPNICPNLNELTSPSTPLPIEIRLAEAAEDVESSYTTPVSSPEKCKPTLEESLPWLYFAVFDGHAGSGVAVAASNTLHKLIQEKLQTIADLIIKFGLKDESKPSNKELNDLKDDCDSKKLNGSIIINQDNHLAKDNIALLFHPSSDKIITVDNLITGALESAFWEMDSMIAKDKQYYRMSGGCTACIGLFILGKLFVANAGDSRAIICKEKEVIPMSFDFTPESERERIKYLGLLRPELLGNDFTHLEFVRRPARRDLGKKLLYRDAYMSGWAYKTITIDDLKFPLIYGEGKRSRVLATIGVTRGFGDHELKAQNSDVDIKPFLTAQPEVRIYDLENDEKLTDSDVLIIGTDGLWDITSNETAAEVVQKSLDHFPANDTQRYKYRYISAAQDLVMHSRGKSKERGKGWKTVDNKTATIDDISVFVIPLKPYREEYINWKSARDLIKSQELNIR